jgi:long-subunit fatty acid transport protein
MKFMDTNGSSMNYDRSTNHVNYDINTMLNDVNTLKLGGEYRINDNLSLRAGYAFKTASEKDKALKNLNLNSVRTDTEFFIDNANTNYFSLGFGYHENNWFIDFAYQKKTYNQTFYPYDYTATKYLIANSKSASVMNSIDNLIATIGLKF